MKRYILIEVVIEVRDIGHGDHVAVILEKNKLDETTLADSEWEAEEIFGKRQVLPENYIIIKI